MIFRYPGGKTRLLPQITPFLSAAISCAGETQFVDAFVGGGSVLCHIAKRHPSIKKLVAIEADDWIAAFWQIVATGEEEDLFLQLLNCVPSVLQFNELRASEPENIAEKAFRAVFFNRTAFSGILTSGPIGGYKQQSVWRINCRYNSNKLIEEYKSLRKLMDGRLRVFNDSAMTVLPKLSGAIYADPPYFEKGNQLYRRGFTLEDHKLLRDVLHQKQCWILSYDDHPTILKLYQSWANIYRKRARYSIEGSNRKTWSEKTELLITPCGLEIDLTTHTVQEGYWSLLDLDD